MTSMMDSGAVSNFIAAWQAQAAQVRANRPAWSTPLVTTTGMLEQRFRFDLSEQHAGNGADTTVIDGGRARFTISLKQSTPNLQISTRTPTDYPILSPRCRLADISERRTGQEPKSNSSMFSRARGRAHAREVRPVNSTADRVIFRGRCPLCCCDWFAIAPIWGGPRRPSMESG
jgi:hypothetical protein